MSKGKASRRRYTSTTLSMDHGNQSQDTMNKNFSNILDSKTSKLDERHSRQDIRFDQPHSIKGWKSNFKLNNLMSRDSGHLK